MMTKEQVVELIYTLANDRSKSVDDILTDLTLKFGWMPTNDITDVLRKYRDTGSNLEATAEKVLAAFNMFSVTYTYDQDKREYDTSVKWEAPEKDMEHFSDREIALQLVSEFTSDDVYVNCLHDATCFDGFEYEDSDYYCSISIYDRDHLIERVSDIVANGIVNDLMACVRQGVKGVYEMNLEELAGWVGGHFYIKDSDTVFFLED